MVWLAVCSKGVSGVIFFEKGTVNHINCISKALPEEKKFGNIMFGNKWTFKQDGATPHTHDATQNWCRESFPDFIDKSHQPQNSPDLNPLDYFVWNEIVQNMNWKKVVSKETCKMQIKAAIRKISHKKLFESCSDFTRRLYCVSKCGGNYIR